MARSQREGASNMKQYAYVGRITFATILLGSMLCVASATSAEGDPMATKNFYRALSALGGDDADCSTDTIEKAFGQGLLTGMVRTWAWSGWLSRPLRADHFLAMIKEDVDQDPDKQDVDIFTVSYDALNSRGYISAAGHSAIAAKVTDEVLRELQKGNR